ncbi:MAG: hypothetical protein COB35_04920 [Gammaproteobacteria bacterium]|nr:MAG: hypothetical protein COB35_04920 [Gammaproteobacteria bacterium]
MEFEDIKQALRANGCSISIIARVLKKSHSAVRQTAMGTHTSKEIATAIAKAINKPIDIVFPQIAFYRQENKFQSKDAQEKYWQEQLAS